MATGQRSSVNDMPAASDSISSQKVDETNLPVFHRPLFLKNCKFVAMQKIKTRMHSSRMRTGRSLTVCQSLLWGMFFPLRGVCSQGGVYSGGVCLLWGSVFSQGGVSAPGGVCSQAGGCLLLGGVCSRGCVCLLWGVVCSKGICSRGRLFQGVSVLGGVCSGGLSAQGVSAPGGCLLLGGVCS